MQEAITLSSALAITWVLVGIIISLLLPVAVRVLRSAKTKLEGKGEAPSLGKRFKAAWGRYGGNRYLGITAAAAFVAIVLVFLFGLKFFTVRDAALAGFAWESLINKLVGGQG